jgi:demethylmenaquinone methyltransferase/2-methoxy-6-polyprenyl-1,4-benzoquinol methylase
MSGGRRANVSASIEQVLGEQRRYYSERAGEYEDWWYRRGRYDHGAEGNGRWFAEVGLLEEAIERLDPRGAVLELACGTGLWTTRLAASAERVTALDASPEALAIARAKLDSPNIRWVQADLFAWEPEERYDVCFFAFWLSHVPLELLDAFLAKVRSALGPTGRVILLDSARSERASARDHQLAAPDQQLERRRLGSGREYQVVKHWFQADALKRRLAEHGWRATIEATEEFFVYGEARPEGS